MTTQRIPTVSLHAEPAESALTCLTEEDLSWLATFTALLRSRLAFLVAERRQDLELPDSASAVLVWRDARFQTVRELVHQCGSHRWHSSIYEVWLSETVSRVRTLERDLDDVAARALKVHAQHIGYYDASYEEMMHALEEARAAMYGEC